MAHPKSMNDEIFEILLRNALIVKYKNEAAAAQTEAQEYSCSDVFRRKIKKIGNSVIRAERIKTTSKILKKNCGYCSFNNGDIVQRLTYSA